jgi:hypothetical protein
VCEIPLLPRAAGKLLGVLVKMARFPNGGLAKFVIDSLTSALQRAISAQSEKEGLSTTKDTKEHQGFTAEGAECHGEENPTSDQHDDLG